jgi:UDP-glucose 4-epimerase
MRIAVTGGAGFIGSNIVDAYIAEGHEVLVLDDFSSGKTANLNPAARVERVDIADARAAAAIRSFAPEILNHHAAQIDVRRSVADPLLDIRINVAGMVSLLEAAREAGVKKVIFASSGGAAYGEDEPIPAAEDHPVKPLSPYGIDKVVGEHYLFFYKSAYGIRNTILRYANVYGPRQDPHGEAGVVAIFSQKMLRGEEVVINGDGGQTRDYVFVGDLVRANLMALPEGREGTFNIGTGRETDVNVLYRHIADVIRPTKAPRHGPAKAGEQRRSALDCSLIRKVWGWKPEVTLEEGLARTVGYFREAFDRENG